MNNSHPPYGNQPGWGQQGMQGYGQPQSYTQQPNQMNPQQGYPAGQAQQPYQQVQQPYAQAQQPYQQVQQPYQQMQQPYQQAQQPYQQTQQPYTQARPYQQAQQPYTQARQPYQQPYTQAQRPYQQASPVQAYSPQGQGNPQQRQPGYTMQQQSYIGYQPPQPSAKAAPGHLLMPILGGLLVVLFILGLVIPGAGALKWIFIVLTLVSIGYLWMRPVLSGSLRLVLSLVGGVMATIALVSALTTAAPTDAQNRAANPSSNQQSSSNVNGGSSLSNDLPNWSSTDVPTVAPTVTPTGNVVSAAQQQLESFLYFWSANNYENMIPLTLPSWRKTVSSPQAELFGILVNRTPVAYRIEKVSGTDNDTSRQITVRVEVSKNNNSDKTELYLYQVLVTREDGIWYIDPRSLKSNEKESTPAPTNRFATQPPAVTGHPDMVLYYNPNGGKLYHTDPNCPSAAQSVLPFKGSFTWSQVNSGSFASLEACNRCNAPFRDSTSP